MKVLIADRIGKDSIRKLQDMGCQVNYKADLDGAELVKAVEQSDCQVLVVRATQVTGEAIRAHRELSLIIVVGEDTDTIDLQAASEESVFVANCGGMDAHAVAELTFGLILALDRRIPDNVFDSRNGKWAQKEYQKARGLKGRTLGVIGMNPVGELVVKCANAFEMSVVGWSPRLTTDQASQLGMIRLDLPEEVAATCDILTVHAGLRPDTYQLVGPNIFEEMKAGSYFINTSRHELVDYDALAQAIVEKHIRAGLDAFDRQPGPNADEFSHPVLKLDGVVYATHLIGNSTEQAVAAGAQQMVAIIKEYLGTGHVRNCVNMSRGKVPHGVLVLRLRNRPGVLARVLGVLGKHKINIREMENAMCEGELSACAHIRLDNKPNEAVIKEILDTDPDNILGVSLTHPGY